MDYHETLDQALARATKAWAPPPKLSLSEWMDTHFYLPAEGAGGDAGKWETIPYQRGIADAMTDPAVTTVTLQKSTRVGFTKLVVGYALYRIHQNPCSQLIVQPVQADAEGFSKEELAPAIRDTPVVDALVAPPKSRASSNTILRKQYPGGTLNVIGAHSGRGFRRLTVDVVIFDETDAYPASAGDEGDQISLGKKRAESSSFPKFLLGSSPKLASTSRICRSFAESDQRFYWVPCPLCQTYQVLWWGQKQAAAFGFDLPAGAGLRWEQGASPDALREGKAATWYACAECAGEFDEAHKWAILERGEWRPSRPEVAGHAGFMIWAGYSVLPQASWAHLAAEFLEAKDYPLKLQVFVNTVLGQAWEEEYESVEESGLVACREDYPQDEHGQQQVPRGVALLTAAIDVQASPARLELAIHGWGYQEENWHLEYHVVYGDTTTPDVWEAAWNLVRQPRPLQRGGVGYVQALAVDTGFHAEHVYQFVKRRTAAVNADGSTLFTFAIKGQPGTGPVFAREPTFDNLAKVPLWGVKVDVAKQVCMERLAKTAGGDPGAGPVHFGQGFPESYFEGLTAERVVVRYDPRGNPKREWERKRQGQANEPWDLQVYNYAVLCGARQMGFNLDAKVASLGLLEQTPGVVTRSEATPGAPMPPEAPPPTPHAPIKRRRRKGRRMISRGIE